MFLEKFFPASRTALIRKEICSIRQHTGKTLYEYWERFNKLCATCPYHQISKQLLIQYFYERLMLMDKSMIDVASGGALMDKTPTAARNLISNMAGNTQGFGGVDGYKQHSVSTKCNCHSLRLANTDWTISHHCEPIAIKWFWTFPFSNNRQSKRECEGNNFEECSRPKEFELDEELLQIFKKVENNIPLLEAIKQSLKCAKFLKELCTHKRNKLKGDVEMRRNVSALIKSEQVSTLTQLAMPKKCRGPATFTIPCTIGECTFANIILGLGVSINVMPSSVYKSLNFGDLEQIGIIT
ncbi:hypothetical protein CR513_26336, partial [Mucuna pruriens]